MYERIMTINEGDIANIFRDIQGNRTLENVTISPLQPGAQHYEIRASLDLPSASSLPPEMREVLSQIGVPLAVMARREGGIYLAGFMQLQMHLTERPEDQAVVAPVCNALETVFLRYAIQ